jgi:hypothetical protein
MGRWAVLAAAAIGLAGFAWIAHEAARGGSIVSWDASVTSSLASARVGGLTRLLWAATLLGDSPLMATYLAAAVILLMAWGRWKDALVLAVGLGLGQGVSATAKVFVDRARPPAPYAVIELPTSASLPSGHAFMTSLAALLALSLLFRWTVEKVGRGHELRDLGTQRRRGSWWTWGFALAGCLRPWSWWPRWAYPECTWVFIGLPMCLPGGAWVLVGAL